MTFVWPQLLALLVLLPLGILAYRAVERRRRRTMTGSGSGLGMARRVGRRARPAPAPVGGCGRALPGVLFVAAAWPSSSSPSPGPRPASSCPSRKAR